MIDDIRFDVVGNAVTQGSKVARQAGGRAWVVEGSARKAREHANWREAVASAAREWQEKHLMPGLLDGPVLVTLRFRLVKPASAPKTRRTWPIKARSGDVDKLARSILDSLTGTLMRDDSQVIGLCVTKDWGDPPGVEVIVRPAPEHAVAALVTWVGRETPCLSA